MDDMFKGWFVGNFHPTLFKTNDVEVAIKKYKAGENEEKHYHKVATEITVIIQGKVVMNNKEFKSGDILTIIPGESTDFKVVEDAVTCVVKIPGVNNDKYLGNNND